jgi:hypothetical protein
MKGVCILDTQSNPLKWRILKRLNAETGDNSRLRFLSPSTATPPARRLSRLPAHFTYCAIRPSVRFRTHYRLWYPYTTIPSRAPTSLRVRWALLPLLGGPPTAIPPFRRNGHSDSRGGIFRVETESQLLYLHLYQSSISPFPPYLSFLKAYPQGRGKTPLTPRVGVRRGQVSPSVGVLGPRSFCPRLRSGVSPFGVSLPPGDRV